MVNAMSRVSEASEIVIIDILICHYEEIGQKWENLSF